MSVVETECWGKEFCHRSSAHISFSSLGRGYLIYNGPPHTLYQVKIYFITMMKWPLGHKNLSHSKFVSLQVYFLVLSWALGNPGIIKHLEMFHS